MVKEDKEILYALGTILFQEGFDREDETGDKLSYFVYPKRSKIREYYNSENESYGDLNLSTKKIDESWYIEIWDEYRDEYDDYRDERNIIAYIPVEPSRLCWEISNYCDLISKILSR